MLHKGVTMTTYTFTPMPGNPPKVLVIPNPPITHDAAIMTIEQAALLYLESDTMADHVIEDDNLADQLNDEAERIYEQRSATMTRQLRRASHNLNHGLTKASDYFD